MQAILINGSPHKNGNTAALLRELEPPMHAAGWKTEFVQLGGEKIAGCRGCLKCAEKRNGKCLFDNDMLNGLLAKIMEADALVLGTPCYFTDVTAEMKALIDRVGYVSFVNGGMLQGKIGAAVVAAGRGGATHAFDTMNHLFLMSKMIVPGSIYWNMGYAREEGAVVHDEEAMTNIRHLAGAIVWLGNAIGPHLPDYPR